jgi:hypothetical protein
MCALMVLVCLWCGAFDHQVTNRVDHLESRGG